MTQKSITNFFKPTPEKRKFIEDPVKNLNQKKLCNENKPDNCSGDDDDNNKIESKLNKKSPFLEHFGSSWYRALEEEFSKSYFLQLERFITNERKSQIIYPPENEVFSWTKLCDLNKVKVIILGQDPYHGKNQAHGLAFSVKKGVDKPPSLINIFKEVKSDYPNFVIPQHGDLTEWAKQGVLLLNACLTVRAGNANSHSNKGWEQFTDSVIKYLNNNLENRVFMLWGNYAQKKGSFINQRKHLVLKTVHPSPLSASRGFFGCSHFKKANDYLSKHHLPGIDWTKLD